MRTEKSRLKRSLLSLQELMRRIRHYKISDQVGEINIVLRGHYEPTAEERGAVKPHSTFFRNRGRATASGDPVGWETERCRMVQATAPILDSTIAPVIAAQRHVRSWR
jgi:hypothetical protein